MSDSNDRLLLINESILTDIAEAIRTKTGKSQKIYPSNMDEEILSITTGTGITPTGDINITTNGSHDVTNYATAVVNVPSSGTTPTGSINITTNGTHDVTNYSSAVVAVDTESHPPITVNITQSEHQTISVSKSMTPVTNNNQVLVPSTVTLIATITPVSGYNAGTLNQTQVTAHWGDTVSFSATPATEKSQGTTESLIFEIYNSNSSFGETIDFEIVVRTNGDYVYYENGKYFDIYINGTLYSSDSFYITEIEEDNYDNYQSIQVNGYNINMQITEADIRRGYFLVEVKDRDTNTVKYSENVAVDSVSARVYISDVSTSDDYRYSYYPFTARINTESNITIYNVHAYIDNGLFPSGTSDYIQPGTYDHEISSDYMGIDSYKDLFSALGKGTHTLYVEASTVNNSGIYDLNDSYEFYLNPYSINSYYNIDTSYSNFYSYGSPIVISISLDGVGNNSSYSYDTHEDEYDTTSTISFIHPISNTRVSFPLNDNVATCTINDLPLGNYSISLRYDGNKYFDEYDINTITFSVTPAATLNVVQPNDGTITVNGQTGTTFTFPQGSSVEIEAIVNRTDGYTFWEWEESNS